MEECGELTRACSKVIRHGCEGKYKNNLIEEIGDVLAMIQIISYEYDISDTEVQAQIAKRQAKMNGFWYFFLLVLGRDRGDLEQVWRR